MVDAATKADVAKIGVLKTKAGLRDTSDWVARLKEEYTSIIKYVTANKESGTDWLRKDYSGVPNISVGRNNCVGRKNS